MDWAWWSTSLDRVWNSPQLPIWATLAGSAFVALLVVIAFLRARRSFANAALAVIAIASLGFAGYATLRSTPTDPARIAAAAPMSNLPALSCIDDLAGDEVMAGCERALFASPETIAAAVSYASFRLARLTKSADAATSPELASLRRSIERDRYGLHAYALASVDRCQPSDCAAYGALGDHSRLAANMDQHLYEMTVARYAPVWTGGAPLPAALPPTAAAPPPVPLPETAAAAPVTMPTGHPNNIDYPTASSIPAVSIMTPEPGAAGSAAPKSAATAEAAPAAKPATSHNLPHAKKPPAPRPPATTEAQAQAPAPPKRVAPPKQPARAPVQLAPEDANADN